MIENRNLTAGTRLVATYKKQPYVCTVEVGAEGQLVFKVEGIEKVFASPSSAAMAVMNGHAANGWRFWSVEGDAPVAAAVAGDKPAPAKRGKSKASKLFKRLPSTGLEEGQHRIFCSACLKSFISTERDPEACPQGHRADDPELNGEPAAEAVAADKAEED